MIIPTLASLLSDERQREYLLREFEACRPKIFYTIYKKCKSREIAEDVVQDAAMRVLRGYASYRGDAKPSTWFVRVATNCYLDYLKAQRSPARSALSLDAPAMGHNGADVTYADMLIDPNVDVLSSVADTIEREALIEALTRLPKLYAQVVYLFAVDGARYEEIAAHLDIPLGTVKSRLNRGRKIVASVLNGEDAIKPTGRPPRKKTDLVRERPALKKIGKARRSRAYPPLLDPNGVVFPGGKNVAAFCRERGLCAAQMSAVLVGKAYACGGWRLAAGNSGPYVNPRTARKLERKKNAPPLPGYRIKVYTFVDAQGVEHSTVEGLAAFCRERGLSYMSMVHLATSRPHSSHRGWRFVIPSNSTDT